MLYAVSKIDLLVNAKVSGVIEVHFFFFTSKKNNYLTQCSGLCAEHRKEKESTDPIPLASLVSIFRSARSALFQCI